MPARKRKASATHAKQASRPPPSAPLNAGPTGLAGAAGASIRRSSRHKADIQISVGDSDVEDYGCASSGKVDDPLSIEEVSEHML